MRSREWMRTRNIWLFITLTLIVCAFAISYYVPISKTSLSDIMTMPNSDKFGVLEIYPTKPGGREWFIDMNNPTKDPGFNPVSNISRQMDGSWQISGRLENGKYVGEVRMEVLRLPGSEEWKNVEMTGYAKIIPTMNPKDSLV
jgi:hypothetical protein